MMSLHTLGIATAGAVIGLVLALTGAGGGIIAIPLLVFGLGLTMAEAGPVGLLAVGLAAGLGAVLGLRDGIVRYRAALLVASAGIATAPLGLWIAHRLPEAPLALLFAALLAFVAQRGFRQARRELRYGPTPRGQSMPCVVSPARGRLRWTLPCARALTGTGMLSGLLAGLLGVGGGFVIIPALTRYTDLALRSIMATSLAVIALVSIGSASLAAAQGALRWEVAIPFTLGAAVALLAGRGIARRWPAPRLQQAFSLLALMAAGLLAARGITALL